MQTTKLSTLLNRMNRNQTISNIEEQLKVQDLDEAIRDLRRRNNPIWSVKKGTLRVFDNVLEYPVAADHQDIIFLDTINNDSGVQQFSKPDFKYTSIQQFYENKEDRNDICELFQNGTKMLGVRYDDSNNNQQWSEILIDDASQLSHYSALGDANSLVVDTVFFRDGESSIRFNNTINTGTASIVISPSALNDSNYKQKYFFVWVYLSGLPTSIDMRFGNDNANYLHASVTTQFSGQAFNQNDWNLIAFDLNTAAVVGTINPISFDYAQLDFVGAAAGIYYINRSYVRQWVLLDYWYYSDFNIATSTSSTPNKTYFIDETTNSYTLDDTLVGDSEWADVVQYDAMLIGLADMKDSNEYSVIKGKRDEAWSLFEDKYPDMTPLITTNRYLFNTDYNTTPPWRP